LDGKRGYVVENEWYLLEVSLEIGTYIVQLENQRSVIDKVEL
jgi:hypothetical protein